MTPFIIRTSYRNIEVSELLFECDQLVIFQIGSQSLLVTLSCLVRACFFCILFLSWPYTRQPTIGCLDIWQEHCSVQIPFSMLSARDIDSRMLRILPIGSQSLLDDLFCIVLIDCDLLSFHFGFFCILFLCPYTSFPMIYCLDICWEHCCVQTPLCIEEVDCTVHQIVHPICCLIGLSPFLFF